MLLLEKRQRIASKCESWSITWASLCCKWKRKFTFYIYNA